MKKSQRNKAYKQILECIINKKYDYDCGLCKLLGMEILGCIDTLKVRRCFNEFMLFFVSDSDVFWFNENDSTPYTGEERWEIRRTIIELCIAMSEN